MIFLTAFSNKILVPDYMNKRRVGQYAEEYKYLLKSISKTYPEATPIYYLFEGELNQDIFLPYNERVKGNDWTERYNAEKGIDSNILGCILHAMSEYPTEDILLLDPDCLVIKKFDEHLQNDCDLMVTTRGALSWRDGRHDIIFNAIMLRREGNPGHNRFLSELITRSEKRRIETKDNWSNVQSSLTDMILEERIKTEVDFKGFPPHKGVLRLAGLRLQVKVIPQYVMSYPIQDEKRYEETCIIHYKNYRLRRFPDQVYNEWMK